MSDISSLKAVFPQFDDIVILSVLEECGGVFEVAVVASVSILSNAVRVRRQLRRMPGEAPAAFRHH